MVVKTSIKRMTMWQAFWAFLAIHVSAMNISMLGYQFALIGVISQLGVMIVAVGLTLYSFFLIVSANNLRFGHKSL